MLNKLLISLVIFTGLGLATAMPASAIRTNNITDSILNRLDEVGDRVYNQDPYDDARISLYYRAGNIIKVVLGLIGLLSVTLFIYAGFMWMTSRGNEDQITTARKTIYASVAGLAVIIAAYVITSFVINVLVDNILKGS
jgi:hypothetical protein